MTESKAYTTAIIAAVPSADDPVHEVVAEDAHVTLQFLGEAADLSEEQVTEIQQTLEMLASVVYPFPVSISGTAELGPDKAQVLIVQSELLTKVREMLGLGKAVSTALASSEQFPNWIPHLTLAYEGEMPDVDSYKTVEIGSLELWLAEDHHAYPLNQKAPAAVTAAGLKQFDQGLHPRGADGRFIEKFGVIKYLSSLGWQYGKVDGIYADDATGAVKLTITPSDLSGNPKGESVVLSPGQVYRAPKKKAHLKTDAVGVKKIGGQGGSNPGGLYEIPAPSDQGASPYAGMDRKALEAKAKQEKADAKAGFSGINAPNTDANQMAMILNPGGQAKAAKSALTQAGKNTPANQILAIAKQVEPTAFNLQNSTDENYTAQAQKYLDNAKAKITALGGDWNVLFPDLADPALEQAPTGTAQFYVKQPKTKSHGNNEALANALYEEAGVPVPEVDFASDGQIYSKIVKGQMDMAQQLNNDAWTDQVRRNFVVDAWLANRDVFGMSYDNILTDAEGVPWRIDNGGALLYRAMGAKKTDFGGQVTELESMRQGKKAKIFGPGMSKAQELDGAERVLAISPSQIDEMVAEHNLPKSLADTLKARRLYIANYYGLTLPEAKKPAEAEEPTTAPLVDAPDIAVNQGKSRNWFKTNLAQLGIFGEAGDLAEFPDGSTQMLGVDDTGNALSVVGEQAQLVNLQAKHGAAAEIFLKKQIDPSMPRPEHGSKLAGADLSQQRWKRGDQVIDQDGVPWKVLLWNEHSGAMLMQFADKDPVLFDTKGADSSSVYTVKRWDPPVPEKLEDTATVVPAPTPVMTEQQALDEVSALPEIPGATTDFEYQPTPYSPPPFESPDTPEILPPVQGKTGQAAVAESQIKADLDQPLPPGNGTPPPPKKTSAPGGAKVMIIGDGTEASTGDAVTSKKDGKTYTFVKPKGQYAVVTDPNGEDPDKQLLKLASTMTQPGKLPAGDLDVELPKTATGEVPALGMMALAKDGWAGEITLISPDGKFVFITDANGKRKRKSTGTVSITSAPQPVPEAPKTSPGPLKPYGPAPANIPAAKAALGDIPFDLDDPADLDAGDMVIVGYADGTIGLEPYTGQPLDSLLKNTTGKVATHDTIGTYSGPISTSQFVQAASAKNNGWNWTVIWNGNIFQTNGKTGPNGGLWLWDYENPNDYAFELLPEGQVLQVVNSAPVESHPAGSLPDPEGIASHQYADPGTPLPGTGTPLYGDEAKTLADWKGQIHKGDHISLDGKNWLEVTTVGPVSGGVAVKDANGVETAIPGTSAATFVIKVPDLKDASTESPWKPEIITAIDMGTVPAMQTGKKKTGDFVQGDVVTDGSGEISIIQSVDDLGDPNAVSLTVMGEDWPSEVNPADEFDFHGNITENPVDIPAGVVAPHLYPGATLQFNSADVPSQVVSYPELQNNGSYKVVVMQNGDPDDLAIVTIGEWNAPGVDVSNEATIIAALGGFTSGVDAGVDPQKINALWDSAKTVDTAPATDHKLGMAEAGIPFGTAAYPIHFNEGSGTYLRQGPNGQKQEWDPETGQWNDIYGSALGYPKVWNGVPFEGSLTKPEGWPDNYLESGDDIFGYKPEPGEIVTAIKVKNIGGENTVLMVYPQGMEGPAIPVWSTQTHLVPEKSHHPMPEGWKNTDDFGEEVVLHDPFAEPSPEDQVTQQQGPQPPSDLGAKFQALGYTPIPGETYWVATKTEIGGMAVLIKMPDGNYSQVKGAGKLGDKSWSPEMLKDPVQSGADVHYTWTYTPSAGDAPAPLAGLPEGFQPFVPGEGQSVLKVTLPNGKQNVYLQKQHGSGWYEMGPDGTVNEHSDAVKSNHAVQMKLAGKGAQTAKYELLHPVPEGVKQPGQAVPEFSNSGGPWTPEPHQKVMALSSYDGDPDPWYWFQNAPGEDWQHAPNTSDSAGTISDATMQGYLANSPNQYALVYDGPSGQSAVDTQEKELPSFGGYTPIEGQKVGTDGGGKYWVQLQPGTRWYPVYSGDVDSEDNGITEAAWTEGVEQGAYSVVWPTEAPSAPETAPATPAGPATPAPFFHHHTPQPGTKVFEDGTNDFWAQKEPGGKYHYVNPNTGSYSTAGLGEHELSGMTQVWPPEDTPTVIPAGTFGGYQTEPGDIVLQLADVNLQPTYVKKKTTGEWHLIKADGTLSDDAYSDATLEWAIGEYQINELQGTVKQALSPDAPDDQPGVATSAYAGVAEDTDLGIGSYHFGAFIPSPTQLEMLAKLNSLHKGESVYALADNDGALSTIVVRNSKGQWSTVMTDGTVAASPGGGAWNPGLTMANDDETAEGYFKSVNFQIHKLQFGAPPAAAPKAPTGPAIPPISGWQGKIPDPASFSGHTDSDQAVGIKAGEWVFLSSANGSGLMLQVGEDITDPGDFKVKQWYAVLAGGKVGDTPLDAGNSSGWTLNNTSVWWTSSGSTSTGPITPVATPSAPSASSPAVPGAPATPAYPGAQKPSQEDINAWGGDLTKDGHIPTAGMYVTGKGPMSGKIVSVSKDKSKATVLTSDGKKTTRLISALKTDLSANYSAYAAPVTAKDIPQGMPLAVDTVAEALQKTVQDGKFRAILTAHQGVSQGQMVVTKSTGPSGKNYNRVHLTLTPDQREQLVAMMAGSGEKGDWVSSSKQSEAVAVGDKLPMRLSSTANPDGTPRWKVDPAQTPPTHEVTAVADDPSGSGVKIVTMKDVTTGEEITSRFHPGKTLTVYNWDPNKPKKVPPGSFSLSAASTAQGWKLVKDGGTSAIKGGADKGQLYHEPGSAVSKSALGQLSSQWQALRNISADGVVIEVIDPKGSNSKSSTGVTVVSIPEGLDETAFGAAMAKLGIDYAPMTQDSAKGHVRGLLRTLLSLDTSDVDTAKGWSDDKLFSEAGKVMGISDLGWQDVLVGVDESIGKTSFFWSDRARNALAAKASYNLIYRAASTASAAQIVANVKYGSASAMMKKTTGMLDGSGSVGNGNGASTDNGNHAGHGSYASASKVSALPSKNAFAGYKSGSMMVYHRPEAVLGRIMDYRVANHDAFGAGQGSGANHLKHATNMGSVRDFFMGGGLPTEAIGFIAVDSAANRDAAIKQLKADGFGVINGRPVEDIIITKQKAATMKPSDLPPVTNPSNARPILDLPTSYDAPAGPEGAVTAAAEEVAA